MPLDLFIRQENEQDHHETEEVVRRAFEKEKFSDKTEHTLVHSLRKCEAFIPELSIVAIGGEKIVGHILFTRIGIDDNEWTKGLLALAPVSVIPEYQNQGIGGRLIQHGHQCAQELGFSAIHVIGHENYYPRFGYEIAAKYGIAPNFEVPEANSMICELVLGGLDGVKGLIKYAAPFGL